MYFKCTENGNRWKFQHQMEGRAKRLYSAHLPAKAFQSSPTLMDCSLLGSSVHGILQARSRLPCPSPGISQTQGLNPSLTSPALAGGCFTTSATREAREMVHIWIIQNGCGLNNTILMVCRILKIE